MSSNLKPKTGGLAAILRLEKERRAQEEKEQQSLSALKTLLPESAPPVESAPPTDLTAPVISRPSAETTSASESAPPTQIAPAVISVPATITVPPAESAAGINRTGQPLRNEPAKEITPPVKTKGASLLPADTPHLRTPHEITDRILPTLKPGCQVVLMRLYRLSAGFGSNTCHVSVPKLASSCNISETQIRIFLRDLEQRRLIKRVSIDLANKIQSDRGVTFEVLLPRLATTKSTPGMKSAGGSESAPPADSEPNKVNTQKETTQTQDAPAAGVRGGSRFTIEECRKYATHLQSTGQGINNPGGYATTIHRTGEADRLIEKYIGADGADAPQVDTSNCPDCRGTGFWYPAGVDQGVAKCPHNKIISATVSES